MNNNHVEVKHWAVVAAAIVAFVASAIWYVGFGRELARLSSIYAEAQAPSVWILLAEFGRSLVVAYVLARLASYLGITDWKGAVRLGAWIWVLPAAILSGSVLHEDYPWMLAAIHAGDWLVKLLLMSIVIGMWARKRK